MTPAPPINLKPLREQVYDHLREALGRGELAPGRTVDLNELSARLGMSRTPLREALLQLEVEGFVTIRPRRGITVNTLSREDIRGLYQMIGALEASVVETEFERMTPELIASMRRRNQEMAEALAQDDFDRYYERNLGFHESYLSLSDHRPLRRLVATLKQRLYDFPRRQAFVKEWELASLDEHARLVDLLQAGDAEGAGRHLRQVHWSYEYQRPWIERYYRQELEDEGGGP